MKRITAREFQRGFGKIAKSLKPGQSVAVTHLGQTLGYYHNAGPMPQRRGRHLLAEVLNHPYSPKEGQAAIDALVADILQ